MKILIVGGGIGGMSAAIEFARLGDDVDLVEIDEDWKAIGTGITLSVMTCRALCDIGLGDDIAAHGFLHDGWDVYDERGVHIDSVLTRPMVGSSHPSEGAILRPILHRLLSTRVEESGVRVRLGDTVASIDTESAQGKIVFESGRTETYDLIVGADGVFSRVRQLVLPDAVAPAYTGQVCWRLLFNRSADVIRGRIYQSEKLKIGFNPCGASQMYMFINESVPQPGRIPQAQLPEIARKLLMPFRDALGDRLDEIDGDMPIIYRPLEWLMIDGPWHKGRVMLIGDAAHATTPHLGSGAGLAVEDAIILPREVHAASGDLDAAFARFMELRAARARFIVETSGRIGDMEIAGEPLMDRNALMAEGFAYAARPY